jgi:hypothetical protein
LSGATQSTILSSADEILALRSGITLQEHLGINSFSTFLQQNGPAKPVKLLAAKSFIISSLTSYPNRGIRSFEGKFLASNDRSRCCRFGVCFSAHSACCLIISR